MTVLCFLDTETTGLDPYVHEVWEVGMIRRNEDGSDSTHVWQLPVDLTTADPKALEIGRFHERRHADFTPLGTFARDFAVLTEEAHLVGAVISFDAERLWRLLWVQGIIARWHYHLVDVEALAAGALGLQPPWKSDDLGKLVGVEPPVEDKHTALGDARWARAIYDSVMNPDNRVSDGEGAP